jgi:squalene-hopene/tetraprenyl-beta-curcumene cyclase
MNPRFILIAVCLCSSPALLASASDKPTTLPKGIKLEKQPSDPKLKKIVFIAGSNFYKPGEHEYVAGCALLMDLVKQTPGVFPVLALDWPKDPKTFEDAKAVVFFLDGGAKHPLLKGGKLVQTTKLAEDGVGLVMLHQGVDIDKDFADRMQGWMGAVWEDGYSQRAHWVSGFKDFPKHPITRGVTPFKIDDGWLYRLRFVDGMKGVSPLLRTINPKAKSAKLDNDAIVSWAYEREGGGRSFAFTGGHLHASFAEDGYRRFLVNGILWAAKIDVPAAGAPVALPADGIKSYLRAAKPSPPTPLPGGEGRPKAEAPSLKKYTPPAESVKEEPLAKQFSLENAVNFLDNAALQWTDKRGCFSCHTNLAFLYARPMVSAQAPAHDDVRRALEDLVSKRWPDKKPRWDAEVVVAAAALAHNDAHTTKELHPLTRTALDRMWTVQQKDGSFRWLKLNQPPMEFDEHYGVTLAALAVGVAPGDYAQTEQAKKGLSNLRAWLKAHPPANLHHRMMLLWVSSYLDGFATPDEQEAIKKDVLAKQLPDGGWSTASLGDWKRSDKHEQTPNVSDGYGTGFSIYVLRRAGVPADDPALQKGIAWLKANQRQSGRWFTRSLVDDNNKHYLAHVGSAFAVMAIQACESPKASKSASGD